MSAGTPMPNPSPKVYIAAAIIGAIGLILAALIGRNTGVSTGKQEAFATAAIQQSTSVVQEVVTQIVVTQIAITQVVADSNLGQVPAQSTPTMPPNTEEGSILNVGQTWRKDGLEITVSTAHIDLSNPSKSYIKVLFINKSQNNVLIIVNESSVYFYDYSGTKTPLGHYKGMLVIRPVEGANYDFFLSSEESQKAITDKNTIQIIFAVSSISSVKEARWIIPIKQAG